MTLCRTVTLLLWALHSIFGTVLGILPVWGWLWTLHPRPWPAVTAWSLAVASTIYMNSHGGDGRGPIQAGPVTFKSVLFAYHAGCRVLEGWERCWQRGALCTLARCLRLYCASHPLSPRGWRALLLTALFTIAHVVSNTFTGMWWADDVAGGSQIRLDTVLWGIYSGCLQLFGLSLSVFTGQLTYDLRLDCLGVLRAAGAWVPDSNKHHMTPGADSGAILGLLASCARRPDTRPPRPPGPRPGTQCCKKGCMLPGGRGRDAWGSGCPHDEKYWRWLRLRHMVLLDMSRMAFAMTSWQVLVMIVFTLTYTATCVSTTVGSFATVQERPYDLLSFLNRLIPLYAAAHRLFLFVFSCNVFQRSAQEHNKLSQELQGFLADTPDVSTAVIREVEKFIVQINLQDGYFDVLGMFRLDIGAVKTILASTATYLVVFMQFKVSLY